MLTAVSFWLQAQNLGEYFQSPEPFAIPRAGGCWFFLASGCWVSFFWSIFLLKILAFSSSDNHISIGICRYFLANIGHQNIGHYSCCYQWLHHMCTVQHLTLITRQDKCCYVAAVSLNITVHHPNVWWNDHSSKCMECVCTSRSHRVMESRHSNIIIYI